MAPDRSINHPTLFSLTVALVAVALITVTLSVAGCNTGDRSPGGEDDPDFDPDQPRLTSVVPDQIEPGMTVSVFGFNLPLEVERNEVVFASASGDVQVPGKVVSVTETTVFSPVYGPLYSIEVVVPHGVRTGTVQDTVIRDSGEQFSAGSVPITAYPHVIGVAFGIDGSNGLTVEFPGGFVPGTVQLYGYNFETVDICTISNGFDADFVTATTAVDPDWDWPTEDGEAPRGIGVVSAALPVPGFAFTPPSVLCSSGSWPLTLTLGATMPDDTPVILNPVEVQAVTNFGGVELAQIAPATVSAVVLPSGVRRGVYEINYQLFEGGDSGAQTRWRVVPEYRDPAVADDDDPNAWVECTSTGVAYRDGDDVLPGAAAHVSQFGAVISPGHPNVFEWDSAVDLPDGLFVTRLRIQPSDPVNDVGEIGDCPNGIWESVPIVIDNTPLGDTTVISEDFSTLRRFDMSSANWNVASGLLIGDIAGPSVYGDGEASIILRAGERYRINTDFGNINRLEDLTADPPIEALDLFEAVGNPGDALDPPEIWVAEFLVQKGAEVEVVGSAPLVIRCSGIIDPGNIQSLEFRSALDVDDTTVAMIDSSVVLSGGNATNATNDEAGFGGEAGPAGGGRGGDGGFAITDGGTQPATVVEVGHGEPGEFGGSGGKTVSMVKPYADLSRPRVGPGCGGPHAESGENGYSSGGGSTVRSQPGIAVRPRGNETLLPSTGGGGGSGGGGSVERIDDDGDAETLSRFGGGGGGGGGSIRIVCDGDLEIGRKNNPVSSGGSIVTDGGRGSRGTAASGAGPGGGGAGGGILLQASGSVFLHEESLLRAMGAAGGRNGGNHYGGDGSPGRIRIEANGPMSLPGLVSFNNVQGDPNITVIADPIDGGNGVGPSLRFAASTYWIDTDSGRIVSDLGANGELDVPGDPGDDDTVAWTAAQSGYEVGLGEFHLTELDVPVGATLVGLGENGLIFRVTGNAVVAGTIDVSGEDGGQVNVTGADPLPGLGGRGGAGGGHGGDGGFADAAGTVHGQDGQLPSNMPEGLEAGEDDVGTPLPAGPIEVATAGTSIVDEECAATGCRVYPGHGAGGGYRGAGTDGGDASTTSGLNVQRGYSGTGGDGYGTALLENPLDGSSLPIGGGGGAGGGGQYNESLVVDAPGTGGGGAGGYFQLSVDGAIEIRSDARILADGGDAYDSVRFGGNGGGGAGGAIRIEGSGLIVFAEEDGLGPLLSATGGTANSVPSIDADDDGVVDYGVGASFDIPSNDLNGAGGDGAPGRILIGSPIPFNTNPADVCIDAVIDSGADVPDVGICPPPSVAGFALADTFESKARTLPFSVQQFNGVRGSGSQFGPALIERGGLQPPGTQVTVVFEGAQESLHEPGKPGIFSGLTLNPSDLDGVEFLRMTFLMYAAEDFATLDSVAVEVDFSE